MDRSCNLRRLFVCHGAAVMNRVKRKAEQRKRQRIGNGSDTRSRIMSAIRSKNNKTTELALIDLFRRHKIHGWRRHVALMGRPDFVFRQCRLAVFVDGCFWHGCQRCYKSPRSNADYWAAKIARNQARDRKVTRLLRQLGWSVCRVWEHSLKGNPEGVVKRIVRLLN